MGEGEESALRMGLRVEQSKASWGRVSRPPFQRENSTYSKRSLLGSLQFRILQIAGGGHLELKMVWQRNLFPLTLFQL